MGYYTEKRKCFDYLEGMLKSSKMGISEDLLVYQLITRFEVGERSIVAYLERLIRLNMAKRDNGYIIWINETNSQKKLI